MRHLNRTDRMRQPTLPAHKITRAEWSSSSLCPLLSQRMSKQQLDNLGLSRDPSFRITKDRDRPKGVVLDIVAFDNEILTSGYRLLFLWLLSGQHKKVTIWFFIGRTSVFYQKKTQSRFWLERWAANALKLRPKKNNASLRLRSHLSPPDSLK
jgi:hypothetical protein